MLNIIPLTYLGNVQYFATLCFTDCVVDVHENYVRQSYRNRCDILAANGAVSLTVPVSNGRSIRKEAVKDVRIDYSKKWQHQHWQSLVSAYRGSPYFDFYAEPFERFYKNRYDLLVDLNYGLTQTLLSALGFPERLKLTENYIPLQEDAATGETGTLRDLRNILAPRSAHSVPVAYFRPEPYWQVFADRMPFAANLSVVDLLFCEGPNAAAILRKSVVGDLSR